MARRSRKRRLAVGNGEAGVSASTALNRRTRKKGTPAPTSGVQALQEDNIIMSRLAGNPIPNGFRYEKYLHVSDLLGNCMRKIALSYMTNTKLVGEPLWDNMLVTFAIGNGVHDAVRDKMQRVRPDEMYGVWRCKCKHNPTMFEGTATQALAQKSCKRCGHDLDTYDEIRLLNEDICVVGSVDLTLLFDRAFYLNEIKSIKKEDWDALARPLPMHILQVVLYWWLARELSKPIHDKVSIFYVTKGHVFGNPYKEFVISPMEHLHRLDEYFEDARSLKDARAGGALPVKICPTVTSPQAKKCEMCTLCFGMED